ncbi:MAG: peptidylprolyl isomerase [Acidobacteria bacterium]|nr:peptidylprolyl isomerase [Acidobacteriota bacterium]
MKRTILFLTMVGLAGASLAQVKATDPDAIVANINGEVLTREEFDRLWMNLSPEMRKNYELTGGRINFLDNHIQKKLLLQEAFKDGFQSQPEVRFLMEQAAESALFDAYVRDVISLRVVPEEESRAYYEQNRPLYRRPVQVRARHIIATADSANVINRTNSNATSMEQARTKIVGLAAQLEGNEEQFAEMAMMFSEDGSAESGGDLGWFGRGKMVRQFDDVVFSLEPGEMSEPFQTEFGWHLVLLEDRREEGFLPYSEVREEIREKLLEGRTGDIIREIQILTRDLRQVSRVSINRENL